MTIATASAPKVSGLDTLKVLAKKIAPGQECWDPQIEGAAKRIWYGDGPTSSDMVYVRGSANALRHLQQNMRRNDIETGDGFHIWLCNSRSDADLFAQIVQRFEGLNFWQVGLSRQYAVMAEYPLVGYLNALEDRGRINAKEEMERTERARVVAHEFLHKDFPSHVGISAILFTGGVGLRLPMEGGLVYKPAERHKVFDIRGELVHACSFHEQREAAEFFAKLAARNDGIVWYFTKAGR